MARRKQAAEVDQAGVMPAEFRRRPVTEDEVNRWLEPGEQMPHDWDLGGEQWWAYLTAYMRWSRARLAWQTEYDKSFWWYWRSRDLPVPPRSQREAYRAP